MHEAVTCDQSARAGRKEWIGLAVLALPAMLIAMDMTVLYLAVPHLSANLNPSCSGFSISTASSWPGS